MTQERNANELNLARAATTIAAPPFRRAGDAVVVGGPFGATAPGGAHASPTCLRPVRGSCVLLAILLVASADGAQAPDFSGKWAVVAPEGGAGVAMGSAPPTLSEPGTMGSGWASEITLAQTASALVVECEYFHPRDAQPPLRLTYALNGAENRNTVNLGRGPQLQVSTAVWRGASLVITTTHAFVNPSDGRAMTSVTRQVLSLPTPDTLAIETFRSAVLGGKASTTRTTYKKRGST